MARPKSMPDFSHLLSSSPLALTPENERPRKKPSISLAAGLIMNAESPRSAPDTPAKNHDSEWSENLFYAYAQKFDSSLSPPYILTFANANIADQWWQLVKQEYPGSAREGPQLFILKSDDVQDQIQDNPRFNDLNNKWFYTQSEGFTGAIPLQDAKGNLIGHSASLQPNQRKVSFPQSPHETKKETPFDLSSLTETLDKMNTMISENSTQIRALSVAQSEGLQRMQEINESNSTQIKALADGQSKLQTIIDQNASHYIALANSQFQNQESVKGILQQNADQIKALAEGQTQLSATCAEMMKSISSLSSTFTAPPPPSEPNGHSPFSQAGNRISPAPRKLNRRIKGVWYEYDASPTHSPRTGSVASVSLDTPPKSPAVAFKSPELKVEAPR